MFHFILIYLVHQDLAVVARVIIVWSMNFFSCSFEVVDNKVLPFIGLLNIKEISLIFMGRNSQRTFSSSMSEHLLVKAISFDSSPCKKQRCLSFSQRRQFFFHKIWHVPLDNAEKSYQFMVSEYADYNKISMKFPSIFCPRNLNLPVP